MNTPNNPIWLQALEDVTRILAGEPPPPIVTGLSVVKP